MVTIANSFNIHFSSIGSKISNEIPPSEIDPLSYCHDFPDLRHLELGGVGPIYVIDIVKAMTSKTSTDLDDISTKFLKSIIGEIALPLSHIFDLSLSSGTFPSRLKASRVVPIFKGGDPLLTDNYRPISLVNAISKILEKIVYHKLVNHLEINKLLYQHQYGFLKGKSTEHALLQILNQIGTALNNNKYCLGVFLDLKKAFDTVPHDILLKKLVKLGITGTTLNWFKSYLSGRTQKVDINGQLSDSCDIDISVLQGTILGPILFLCYINDLPNATDLFSILYADDTTALDSDDDLDVLINRINLELKKLANWFRSNKMQLNVNKTKYIIFHVPSKKINTNLKLVIDENSEDLPFNQSLVTPIERIHNKHENVNSRSFKLLGIYFDENLNFNANTAELTKKLSRAAFFINRVKNTLSTKALKMLYTSFFHCHLLYCPLIYSCTSSSNINKIFTLQKKAIRSIMGAKYRDHTKELFKKANILPLEKIIRQSKSLFMHSIFYNYAPVSFENIWTKITERNLNQDLRNENDFILPFPRIELFKKLPTYSLPHNWNQLKDIRYQPNRFTFKTTLSNDLLAED